MKFGIDDDFENLLNNLTGGLGQTADIGKMRQRFSIAGPQPYRVEYPYGRPGDGLRRSAQSYNATCISYHRNVNPEALKSVVEFGNKFRYGPESEQYQAIRTSMKKDGFLGGPGQQIIVHVDGDRAWFAEGNHRMKIALEVGIDAVEVQIRYLQNADEAYLIIPFDHQSGRFRVDG